MIDPELVSEPKKAIITTIIKRILERDWLSPSRFEHQQDNVRVMLVIRQCYRIIKGTANRSCLCKWTERVMSVRSFLVFRRVDYCFVFFCLSFVYFFNENEQLLSQILPQFCLILILLSLACLQTKLYCTVSYYHYKSGS